MGLCLSIGLGVLCAINTRPTSGSFDAASEVKIALQGAIRDRNNSSVFGDAEAWLKATVWSLSNPSYQVTMTDLFGVALLATVTVQVQSHQVQGCWIGAFDTWFHVGFVKI